MSVYLADKAEVSSIDSNWRIVVSRDDTNLVRNLTLAGALTVFRTWTGSPTGHLVVGAGAVETVIRSNWSAASDPTTGDDSGDGYAVGSVWTTTAGKVWLCTDATLGSAVWKDLTASSAPGGSSGEVQYNNGSGGFSSSANIVIVGGNLGVRATSPGAPIEVRASDANALRIYTTSSSFGYTIGRNVSTGFLDILGNQGSFSGINVDAVRAGGVSVNGNAVLTSWGGAFGVGPGSGTPAGLIELRAAGDCVFAMGAGAGFSYTFTRSSSTGWLEFNGQQSGYCGYIFKLVGTAVLTVETTGITSTRITASEGISAGAVTFSVLNATTATATLGIRRITDRGNKLAYPDGTNWRFVGDDAIIS